jgi:hypothetical protein
MTDAPDVISSGSPEAMHTRGGDNAHMQITRIELGERAKSWLFAISVVVNILTAMAFFWFMQEKRVDEEYHIQTQAGLDKAMAHIEQLEKSGPMTIVVKQEK